jgi:predicted transcriptional regulator YheO
MDKTALFDLLEQIADGIVAIVGPHCEVVIHDFSDLEHSLVHISGNLTGRREGAPISDLDYVPTDQDDIVENIYNFKGRIAGRELQFSTIWIRDSNGIPIGSFGINIDYSGLNQVQELLNVFSTSSQMAVLQDISDELPKDLDELITVSIQRVRSQEDPHGVSAMSNEEKKRIVKGLDEQGVFKLRGAVNKIAEMLDISRASVYNYRSQRK